MRGKLPLCVHHEEPQASVGGEVAEEVRSFTREICQSLETEIRNGHRRPDQVHLLLEVAPKWAPESSDAGDQREDVASFAAGLSETAKGVLGRHLWARGYFVATTGSVNDEMVAQYIETQDAETEDDDFRVTE